MSFILDALRKSEHQRQRHIGPSLADAPVRRRQEERPWWAIALAALLVANLGVLVIVLTRDDGNAEARAATVRAETPVAVASPPAHSTDRSPMSEPVRRETAPATTRIAQPPPAPSPRVAASVRSLADEAELTGYDAPVNPALAAAANVPEGPPRVRAIGPPAGTPLEQPIEEPLPEAAEVALSGASVPDLHLDIHVFSNVPAERFVFINMRKYVEGEALQEGPTIERIRADGVVLNQRGTRFLLPRQ